MCQKKRIIFICFPPSIIFQLFSPYFSFSFRQDKSTIDYPLLFHPKKIKRLIKDVSAVTNNLFIDTNPMNENQLKADADFWINCWNREFDIDINNLIEID